MFFFLVLENKPYMVAGTIISSGRYRPGAKPCNNTCSGWMTAPAFCFMMLAEMPRVQ